MHAKAAIALCMLLVCGTTQAGFVFSDDFNSENAGVGVLNYGTVYGNFANWVVSDGTVDLIGNGFYDYQPGYGLYVDMDGSTGDAGRITTTLNLIPGIYEVSFDLAGNHRNNVGEQVTVLVSLGALLNESFSLPRDASFTTFTRTFVVNAQQSVSLSFEGVGGDNVGMLLDNVSIQVIPAPAAVLLGVIGLSLVASLKRRG